MKKIIHYRIYGLLVMILLFVSTITKGQLSSNTVKYKVTYNPVNQVYTAWVVPDYTVPNANNLGIVEFGGTAQFTLVVPSNFVITNITDIKGTWTKVTDSDFKKLGPGNPGQIWTGLDPALNYYLIGKAPSETNYGAFLPNVPVALFSFTGNSCQGLVYPLPANDPFITAADVTYGLNAGNSFYSRSGQPSGGNQKPLEQFVATTGPAANCLPLQALPDVASATAGISTNISVLGNDKNNDGSLVSLLTVNLPLVSTLPSKGVALVNLDGSISYTPLLGSTGTDSFIYTICDKLNLTVCDTALVTVNITGAPQAIPDVVTTTAGVTSTLSVLLNDKNADGTLITNLLKTGIPTITTAPTKGTLTVNLDGTLKYIPNVGTSGTDSFIYSICDLLALTCDTAKVTINITAAPQALPDVVTATAGIAATLPVLINDKNADGSLITNLTKIGIPVVTVAPTKGTLTVNLDGTLKYIPNLGTTGTDSFIYSICDLLTLACDTAKVTINITGAPQALPDVVTATAGISSTLSVLVNDKNSDGTLITNLLKTGIPVITVQPTKGVLTVNLDGTLKYIPNLGTTGTDSFIYSICDLLTLTCDTAKVTINLTGVPQALPDVITATAGIASTLPVLVNDKNSDGTLITNLLKTGIPTITVPPTKGILTVNLDGTLKYIPNLGTSGTDSFIYSICDLLTLTCDTALVNINITGAPQALPDVVTTTAGVASTLSVLLNDKNSDGTLITNLLKTGVPIVTVAPTKGTLSVNLDGTLKYIPNLGTSGADSFIYSICDLLTLTCDTAKVTINITGAPQALPDVVTATAGLSSTLSVLVNDKNSDGSLITNLTKIGIPVVTVAPTKGTLTVNLDGTLNYIPNLGTTGTDSFIYSICDLLTLACDTAKVTINLTGAPQALPDVVSATAGVSSTLSVLVNDKNSDGTLITNLLKTGIPVITVQPTKGVLTVNLDGTLKYIPNLGTTGTDSFIYSICDLLTLTCDTAKVTINLTGVPQALPDVINVTEGVSSTLSVLLNDKNSDGTFITNLLKTGIPTITVPPTKGILSVNLDGTLKYIPNIGSSGTDTFIYSICDLLALTCDTTLVTIKINQKPIATNDIAVVLINKSVVGNVLTNDFDLDGGKLLVSTSPVTAPTKGTLTLNTNGTYTYTPNVGVTGYDTFCYQVCDNGSPSACDTACVSIQIVAEAVLANNAPLANDDNTQTILNLPIIINAKANDIDPEGFATLGLPTKLTNPAHGIVLQLPDGTFTYTPTLGYIGQDFFTYSICDNGTPSKCDTATITITVLPLPIIGGNKAPVALDDAVSTLSGTPTIITVKSNDSDPDGNLLGNPTIVAQPASGTVSVNLDGSVTYTPANSTFVGTSVFTYAVCDIAIPSKCDTATVSVLVLAPNKVALLPKAYLQGALLGVTLPTTLMRDDLRVKNLIPAVSPYSVGLTTVGSVTNSVLAVTGNNAIVDWVFLELRSSTDPTLIVDSRSALIQRDGDIVDVDGVSPVVFSKAFTGSYYVTVAHRNHLAVMSSLTPMSNIATTIDFRSASTVTFNLGILNIINQPLVVVEQGKALWAGNALGDKNIIYQGTENDVNQIYQQIINASGNTFVSLSYKLKGYFSGDIDMNGEVIFQGTGNDVEFIYQNVIKNHIGNTFGLNYFVIKQQLP